MTRRCRCRSLQRQVGSEANLEVAPRARKRHSRAGKTHSAIGAWIAASHYSAAQVDAALGSVFGVDRQLIRDENLLRRRRKWEFIGCGGWSKRKTLFGSDHQTNRDDAELDPARDPARIRAFFVHPDCARRGLGRAILEECEKAIRASGFRSIELAATLPGVPFYAAFGYLSGERSDVPLPNNLSLGIVRMTKTCCSGACVKRRIYQLGVWHKRLYNSGDTGDPMPSGGVISGCCGGVDVDLAGIGLSCRMRVDISIAVKSNADARKYGAPGK